jgi:hypothetical protein
MKNNLTKYIKRGFKLAYNVDNILPLICSSLVLTLPISIIQDGIKKNIGTSNSNLLMLLFVTLALVILAPIVIGLGLRQTAKAKSDPLLASKDRPQLHKGLILLVSNEQPCQVAIDFHLQQNTLKQCWLICSIETLPIAQSIRSFNQDKITIDDPIVINDIYDPAQFIGVIDTIYNNAVKTPKIWRESDIIADFSGMTANGSVGMALACNAKNRPLQYTPAKREAGTNKIIGSSEPIEIKLQ